ncbi:MAG: T9SS type A sorting domain-containing protein [Bacteroidia bacterium]
MRKVLFIILSFCFFLLQAQIPKRINQKVVRNVKPLQLGASIANSQVEKVITDKNGNNIIAGELRFFSFCGLFNFDLKNALNYDVVAGIFLAKYDSLNNLVWYKNIYADGDRLLENLEIDNNNNVILSFRQQSNGPGQLSYNVDLNPDHNVFANFTSPLPCNYIAKYDANGNYIFGGKFDSPNRFKISFDKFNNIYLYGTLTQSLNFNINSTTPAALTYSSGPMFFVAKYDSVGTLLFKDKLVVDDILKLRITQNKIIMVSRDAGADYDFGPGISLAVNSTFVMATYDLGFNFQNLKYINFFVPGPFYTGQARPKYYLDCDTSSFYLFGICSGTVDFNPGPGVNSLPASDSTFFARYDNNLNLVTLKSFGNVMKPNFTSPQFCVDKNKKEFYVSHQLHIGQPSWNFIDYDPSPLNYTLSCNTNKAVSIGKFDSTANFINAKIILDEASSLSYNHSLNFGNNKLACFGMNRDSLLVDPSVANTKLKNKNSCGLYSAIFNSSLSLVQSNINSAQYAQYSAMNTTDDALSIVKSGNDFFITGLYSDMLDYNANPAASYTFTSSTYKHGVYIAKYNNNFNVMFVKELPLTGYNTTKIAKTLIDHNGDLIIAGVLQNDAIYFNPSNVFSAAGYGSFVAKYSPTGNLIWFKGYQNAQISDFDIDSNDNIFVVGRYQGPTIFNTAQVYSGPNWDAFLLKLSPNSNFNWVENTSCNGLDYFSKIKIDKSDNMIIIGNYQGSAISFLSSSFPSNTSGEGTIYKISPSKNVIFAYATTGTSFDQHIDFDIDQKNSIVLFGVTNSNNSDMDYGAASALLTFPPACNKAYFFAKYDSLFNFKYFKSLPDVNNTQFVDKIKIDTNTLNTYLYGVYNGTIDVDPGTASSIISGNSSLVAKYDSLGNCLFAEKYNKKSLNKVLLKINDMNFDNDKMRLVGSLLTAGINTAFCPLNNFELDTTLVYNIPTIGQDIFMAEYCNTPNTPIINSGNLNLCSGNSTTLNASGGNPKWYNVATGGSPIFIGNTFATPNLTSSTTYYLQDSNSCGLSNRLPVIVNVFSSPQPIITGNSSICLGKTDTLTVIGATSYTWSNGSTSNMIIVTPTTTTSYSISTINPCGTSSAAISVLINPAPIVSANNGSICIGQTYTINPIGALTYTYSSGTGIVSPTVTTFYSVIGTSTNGCVNNPPTTLTVFVNPNPTVVAIGTGICFGQSFTISPYGANTYTYSGGSAVVSPTASTSYSVTGTSTAGCVSVSPAICNMIVYPQPTVSANSGTICPGGSFTIYPIGANTYTISGGSNIVSPAVTSSYTITGTNGVGCQSASPAIVVITVSSLPTITVNNGTICSGQSFTIVPNGAFTYTYSSGSDIVSPTTNTSYSVTGTNVDGCVSIVPAISNVTVNVLPVVNATTSNSIICTGQPATLTSSGANTYTWSNSSIGNFIVIYPTVNTTYGVMGTDANGCQGYITITQSVSLCTGIDLQSVNNNSIKIYPNPTSAVFNIELINFGPEKIVEMYNCIGQLIILKEIDGNNAIIDLTNFANGLYIIKIRKGNEIISFSKIVKE